jgi:hypothetical protein
VRRDGRQGLEDENRCLRHLIADLSLDKEVLKSVIQKKRVSARDDECGLLLVPTQGGIPQIEAEHKIGLPMYGVFRSADHTAQLLRWIAQD